MMSLLALMDRAITYFKEPKSVTGATSGTNSEVSTDDEFNNVDCGRSNKVVTNVDYKWEYCEVCDRFLKPRDYMNAEQMCQCCHEISLGNDKQCESCGEFKHITLFQKPKLFYCEQCASDLRTLRQYCHSCKYVVQRGYWHNHIQTKKHRFRSYIERRQFDDEYQGEYDKCIACNSLFQQTDLLNEHVCVNV
jgi:hypothetical protein